MTEIGKPINSLTVADLASIPVWRYTNRDAVDETLVRPVKRLPVTSLTGKVIGTEVRLGNGAQHWALLGNIDASNPRLTEQFLTLSLEKGGEWFALARYHDFDYEDRGPAALARFLGLDVDSVFPISYDVRRFANGHAAALAGTIPKEPRERLSRDEIMALAVP